MFPHNTRGLRMERVLAGLWVTLVVWACFSPTTHTPTVAFLTLENQKLRGQESGNVVGVLERIAQTLDSHERHTALYERVSLLEENLNKKTENEMKLESEVLELKAKIPALEAEIQTIPEMKKDLAEFEAKIEKLVHDYEAKLSTLASEVIRLKKNGARRKDLQTLSDGSDNVLLRIDAPMCPQLGLGMTAERVGGQCLYFSWGTALNWTAAHRHCQSLGGDLAAPQDLRPLKEFLHRAFARGPSIWLGASYNIDGEGLNNNTESKEEVNSTATADLRQQNITVGNGEGSFSFRLDILGAGGIPSNRIDDEADSGEESGRDRFSSNGLFDSIALRDEAIVSSSDELTSAHRNIPQRLLDRVNLIGASSIGSTRSRLPDTSRRPVVDFKLLKDPVNSVEETLSSQNSNHPSIFLTSESSPVEDSGSSIHSQATTDAHNARVSPGTLRDVRDVLDNTVDQQEDSEVSDHRVEDSKNTGKARMNCVLLQQKESSEYELVGQPCDEQHRFVCEILSSSNSDRKFTPDNLLHE